MEYSAMDSSQKDAPLYKILRGKQRPHTDTENIPPPPKDLFFHKMLHEWHGSENANGAVSQFLPKAESLNDVLKRVMEKHVHPSVFALERLRQNWTEIAGVDNARHSIPIFIKEKVLLVEVAHPIYRMGLDSPTVKKQILSKIHAVLGEELCNEIKFDPPGRRAK